MGGGGTTGGTSAATVAQAAVERSRRLAANRIGQDLRTVAREDAVKSPPGIIVKIALCDL
jgi:hypothetical protein